MRVKSFDSSRGKTLTNEVDISTTWNVLGPFQAGTREATWGADPLECYGGFCNLLPSSIGFPSSLAENGEVHWKEVSSRPAKSLYAHFGSRYSAELNVAFPEIHWKSLQAVYGWAAFQYQAWARGKVVIRGDAARTVRLSVPGALEYALDGEIHFGGDFYSTGKSPLAVTLSPGVHKLDVRLLRDVRSMGGVGEPTIELQVVIETSDNDFVVYEKDVTLPDLVNGRLVSDRGSIPVQNLGKDWVRVLGVETSWPIELVVEQTVLAPGQMKDIQFLIPPHELYTPEVSFVVKYERDASSLMEYSVQISARTGVKELTDPHKVTFQQSNGGSAWAVVKAPALRHTHSEKTPAFPVMLYLHGAGVEADSDETMEMLKSIGDVQAWILLPTGGTPWSSDDWHTAGWSNVEAALQAIRKYAKSLFPHTPGVDTNSLYVVGHSNGGQGTWYALTHFPDKICAAAPVSGYTSIQKYVPYSFTRECDPKITAVIHGAMANYRHELLLDNCKGIGIQQQHGSADDNVPPLHSRRMNQLRVESGSTRNYNEIPGAPHWYPDIMATAALQHFYAAIADHPTSSIRLPKDFAIVIPGSGDSIGSRGGIVVDQLRSLGQFGRVDIHQSSEGHWNLKTSNVHRLHFGSPEYLGKLPSSVSIDGFHHELGSDLSAEAPVWLHRNSAARWTVSRDPDWMSQKQRAEFQYGTIHAILRTKGEIQIRYHSKLTFEIALQSSRNLYQYYSLNTDITHEDKAEDVKGNIISIREGKPQASNAWSFTDPPDHPIQIISEGIKMMIPTGWPDLYENRPGLGAIYLAPLSNQRLQLVVWGFDKKGLQQAIRLIPGLTGVGQPDFVIFGPDCPGKGAAGSLAMGFFDHDWSISRSSYTS